jgi:hypothetical protein
MTGTAVRDIEVMLADRPGALADFAEILGAAGVSLEGGGVFGRTDGPALAHFLVADAERARDALAARGIGPVVVNDVITVCLDQERPGQLGLFTRRLADAGVDIRVQYSDHANRLVLVVAAADHAAAVQVAAAWDRLAR